MAGGQANATLGADRSRFERKEKEMKTKRLAVMVALPVALGFGLDALPAGASEHASDRLQGSPVKAEIRGNKLHVDVDTPVFEFHGSVDARPVFEAYMAVFDAIESIEIDAEAAIKVTNDLAREAMELVEDLDTRPYVQAANALAREAAEIVEDGTPLLIDAANALAGEAMEAVDEFDPEPVVQAARTLLRAARQIVEGIDTAALTELATTVARDALEAVDNIDTPALVQLASTLARETVLLAQQISDEYTPLLLQLAHFLAQEAAEFVEESRPTLSELARFLVREALEIVQDPPPYRS
jgi:hypothetical protein